MSTTQAFKQAADIYRATPNTYGHEGNEDKRRLLKTIIGLVASQVQLQDSIADARARGYYDDSKGMAHLWDRLTVVENDIRKLEDTHGTEVKSREYITNHR